MKNHLLKFLLILLISTFVESNIVINNITNYECQNFTGVTIFNLNATTDSYLSETERFNLKVGNISINCSFPESQQNKTSFDDIGSDSSSYTEEDSSYFSETYDSSDDSSDDSSLDSSNYRLLQETDNKALIGVCMILSKVKESIELNKNNIKIFNNNQNISFKDGFSCSLDKYYGNFENGIIEGNGIFYWEDGSRWEGTFSNNKLHGDGTFYNPKSKTSFSASYKNNRLIEESNSAFTSMRKKERGGENTFRRERERERERENYRDSYREKERERDSQKEKESFRKEGGERETGMGSRRMLFRGRGKGREKRDRGERVEREINIEMERDMDREIDIEKDMDKDVDREVEREIEIEKEERDFERGNNNRLGNGLMRSGGGGGVLRFKKKEVFREKNQREFEREKPKEIERESEEENNEEEDERESEKDEEYQNEYNNRELGRRLERGKNNRFKTKNIRKDRFKNKKESDEEESDE